jgi:DNA-directed RNA polymerase subunit alpha
VESYDEGYETDAYQGSPEYPEVEYTETSYQETEQL